MIRPLRDAQSSDEIPDGGQLLKHYLLRRRDRVQILGIAKEFEKQVSDVQKFAPGPKIYEPLSPDV